MGSKDQEIKERVERIASHHADGLISAYEASLRAQALGVEGFEVDGETGRLSATMQDGSNILLDVYAESAE